MPAYEAFVATYGLEAMPHAIDPDGSLWARYGIGYQPAWVFINQDGQVRVNPGGLYGDGIAAAVEELIAR